VIEFFLPWVFLIFFPLLFPSRINSFVIFFFLTPSFFSFLLFLLYLNFCSPQISSVKPGSFHCVCVFDGDTVLDHFDILLSDLLESERAMQNKFRPGHSIKAASSEEDSDEFMSFGRVAKTSFHIKNLLRKLEAMSMGYKMLQVQ